MSLSSQINSIPSDIRNIIDSRLQEFSSFSSRPGEDWFSELCFCLLTANAKAQTALEIQNKLGYKGFMSLPQQELMLKIKENKHRFHNNKSKYISEARKYSNIKNIIQKIVKEESEGVARDWLVKNVKGLGLKEASHFLRNTGHTSLAILDRHILNIMVENNLIDKPKSLSPRIYLDIEKKFQSIANANKVNSAKLDLQLWYLKTGRVLK